jgi:spore maturation protein CgeB
MPTNNRILIIGVFSTGSLGLSYASAYGRVGYEVFRFDYDDAYFHSGRITGNRFLRRTFRHILWNRMNQSTLEMARSVRPALILALKAPYLNPETILDLRRLGAPVVNYYPDNPYCGVPLDPRKTSAQRHDLIDAFREYTRLWIWQPALAAKLARDGVSAGYMPFASDPEMYLPYEGSHSKECPECHGDHKVILIGQHNAKRQAHVAAIRNQSVGLWGARWARAGSEFASRHRIHRASVFGTATSKLYSQASVSLNVVDDLNMPGHNMRTFEIPASAGVMLAPYTDEQAEFFPESEAAAYYRSPQELDAKIDWLLGDDTLRKRIRGNAARLAASQTYDHRALEMLRECGLIIPASASSHLNNPKGLTS